MMIPFKPLLFLMFLFPTYAIAQSSAVVESLLMPAWVDRGNQRVALAPGMALNVGDKIGTGDSGKALVRLEEGSDLKLGANMEIKFNLLQSADSSEKSVFRSSMNILKGAFRFTTKLVAKTFSRDIEFQVGTITAGIRGTDLWGKSTAENNFVVLLEGVIDMHRADDPVVRMDQPLTIYEAPAAEAARPITIVDKAKLAVWAQETELDPGKGIITIGGQHAVYLASYRQQSGARKARDSFQQQGYAVEIFPVQVSGSNWFRLGIKGFNSRADATYFSQASRERFGISGAWVSKL